MIGKATALRFKEMLRNGYALPRNGRDGLCTAGAKRRRKENAGKSNGDAVPGA